MAEAEHALAVRGQELLACQRLDALVAGIGAEQQPDLGAAELAARDRAVLE